MNILSKAIKEYNNANYKLALELFEKSAEIYGIHIVDFNIKKCKKELGYSSSSQSTIQNIIEKPRFYKTNTQDILSLTRENEFLTEMIHMLQSELEKAYQAQIK